MTAVLYIVVKNFTITICYYPLLYILMRHPIIATVLYIMVRNYTITVCYFHALIYMLMRHPIMAAVYT